MKNEVWEKDVSQIPPGYQQIKCRMMFDVIMVENFDGKAQFVAGGHTRETPLTLTYWSVVSRDLVRIILLEAALNGLSIVACDIQNAYVTADCREKIWTIAGPEFGSEKWTTSFLSHSMLLLFSSLYRSTFKLKDDKIEPPSDIDGKTSWFLSSEKYVKFAIENGEQILQKGGQ